ncbi:MAG TPA: PIG-L family deacetylase [Chthonomonadales bacterium]|nr:PIG-L family deacetylase [Chthonomonadales bacterium]
MGLHVVCIGAHPDDNESYAGGTAALLRDRGDTVRFVAVTNGSKGHFAAEYAEHPERLVRRRHEEALRAAAVIGAGYACLGYTDGELHVTPEATERVVRALRLAGPPGLGPDLVLMNRPVDYHRDHRYCARLVLDAAYMLTVPAMCPDAPALRRLPVFAYWRDRFSEGGAFRPDVAVDIGSAIERKIDMMASHASQFYEWIPYNEGAHVAFADFPAEPEARRARLAEMARAAAATVRREAGDLLPVACRWAEAFQISEYGHVPDPDALARLFP